MIRKRSILSAASALIVGIAMLLSPGKALATSFSWSTATIDWNTFALTLDPGMDITWDYKEDYVLAYAEDDSGSDLNYSSISPWGAAGATASAPYALGYAWTNPGTVGEEGKASADGVNTSSSSYASAERWGEFQITGSGSVTLSVDYELTHLLTTEYTGESAYGYSYAELWLESGAGEDSVNDLDSLMDTMTDGATGAQATTGSFSVSLPFIDGQAGTFGVYAYSEAAVSAVAPVPEPGTMLLLGSGLLALPFLRKRLSG